MVIDAGRVRARWRVWVAALVLAMAWFATLQDRPLFDPDEGRYAEIPREMAASGDWLTPRLDGLKYFEKPPLQYWATAAAYSIFGVREWTSRVWTVGLAFACLPLVFGWCRRLYGTRAGLAAVVALAVSPYFAIIGHLDLLDGGFAFWLTAAVFAFTLAQSSAEGSGEERRWMLLAWLAAALAVLTKGIVVGVLTGASLIVYSVVERDLRPWKRLHAAWGVPLFLLVAAPWFIAVSVRNPDFPEFFFIHEHFARFLTTVHQRVEPWWFFLPLLLLGVLPWGLSIVRASVRAWRDAGPTPQFKPLRFLLIYCVFTVVFFSASGSKLAPYLQPVFPSLAAIWGAYVAQRAGFLRVPGVVTAILVTLVGSGLLIQSALHNSFIPLDAVGMVAIAVLAVLCAAAVPFVRRELDPALAPLVVAGLAVIAWECFLSALATVPPARSARDLVASAKPYVHPQTTLYSVGQYRETISPYLRRTLIVVSFKGELEFGLQAEPGKQSVTADDFEFRWRAGTDAVAFFDPNVWESYRRHGLPGRVIAADNRTVAVSRS